MIEHPNLTATASTKGVKAGIPGGLSTVPGGSTSIPGTPRFNAQAISPLTAMASRHRPQSFVNFHISLKAEPEQASRDLDAAINRAYENNYRLETMIACTQYGKATIIGSAIGIPTGLATVSNASGSIDTGATPHNFTLSITPSQVPGAVDVHVYQPKATTDNTPVSATTPVSVRWSATGSL